MDPQATWDQLLCAYAAGDWDAIEERATALIEWLDRGGFPPKVLSNNLGPDWDRALARAGCLHALETVQGQLEHPGMNIRDLSALERTAHWLDELIEASRRGGLLYSANQDLVRDVTRKAKALRTSLTSLRSFLIPHEKESTR